MLLYIWFAVIVQAFMPGVDRIGSSFEARLHSELDSSSLVGAAGHMARYTPLVARAR